VGLFSPRLAAPFTLTKRSTPVRSSLARALAPPEDNAALLRACRAGDQEAWEQLVRRYQRLIYTIPRRAGLGDDAAAEVFQRVWLTLFEHLHRIERPERLASWLATTARRESLRQLRLERAQSARSSGEELYDEAALLPDPALLPDELIERVERRQLVREALGDLDERCRTLLTLLFARDEPPAYAEIAAAIGVPEGSVGPTRARCLRKLQRALEDREG
jgi:RNA polymerase sigma factor (sigma-70 family)